MESLFTSSIFSYIATAVLAGLVWLAYRAAAAIRRTWMGDRTAVLVERLAEHARAAVLATHQTYVEEIRRARADGRLDDTERAAAKAEAMRVLRAHAEWDALVAVVGASRAADIASARVESALAGLKSLGVIPRPTEPPAPAPGA